MVTAYVALGANLGAAVATLKQAWVSIDALPFCSVEKTSRLYKTAPLETLLGCAPGNDYINAVVEIQTTWPAPVLLQQLQQIEQFAGRQRPYINAPRTLDLDLLLYGSGSIDSANLTVPHPRMWQRAFVLVPLAEIAPGLVDDWRLQDVQSQAITVLDDRLQRHI